MDLPKRKHPRLKVYDYSSNGAYFITICTKNKQALLGTLKENIHAIDETALLGAEQMELTTAGEICRAYLEKIPDVYEGVVLDCYVMMPNHIHMVLRLEKPEDDGGQGSGRPTIQTIVHAFKRLSARQVGRELWQASFYDRVIRNEAELDQVRRYVMGNPIKWRALR